MVQPINKGPTEAMAPATATLAAIATTAMAEISKPELHTNEIQHLARLATIARRKNTSRVIATKGNMKMHLWLKCKNWMKTEVTKLWNPSSNKKTRIQLHYFTASELHKQPRTEKPIWIIKH